MHIRLLAVGNRPPQWVAAGVGDYVQRMRKPLGFTLQEISPGRGSDPRRDEGERLLRALEKRDQVVLFDVGGKPLSTPQWADALNEWRTSSPRVALIIGGADGVSAAVQARADHCWSLSRLTLPHMLARILVVEQLYRAWSILQGHPYHRG